MFEVEDIEDNDQEIGYVNLVLKNGKSLPNSLKHLIDKDGHFMSPVFTSYFYQLALKAMSSQGVWDNNQLYWTFKRTFDLRGSNFYIALKSPLENFNDIEISIDFVPVVEVTKWKPKMAIETTS